MSKNFLSPEGRACPPLGGDKGEGEGLLRTIEKENNPLTLTLLPAGRQAPQRGEGEG